MILKTVGIATIVEKPSFGIIALIVSTVVWSKVLTQDRIAINTSSSAEAKVLRIEFRFLRKKLVTIPTAALLAMMINTAGCHTW